MKKLACISLLLLTSVYGHAQNTFKVGTRTFKIGTRIKTYTYSYSYAHDNNFNIHLIDQEIKDITPDSLEILNITPLHGQANSRYLEILNDDGQVVRKLYYLGDMLTKTIDLKYDSANRVISYQLKQTNASYHNFIRTYKFKTTQTKDGTEEVEYCYFNGQTEFITTHYYDKKHKKYKEVRVNDVGKVLDIEKYNYAPNGQLIGWQTYFPEFGITKNFKAEDNELNMAAHCRRTDLLKDMKLTDANKESVIHQKLVYYEKLLFDTACSNMDLKLKGNGGELIIKQNAKKQTQTVTAIIREELETTHRRKAVSKWKVSKKVIILPDKKK